MTIKPIRTPADLKASKARLGDLLMRSASGDHDDEIEVLMTLIEQFEHRYAPINTASPLEAIRFRMEEKRLTPRQLEPFIGSRARVSEILSGKRQLSIDMMRSLHEGLNIPYAALMSEQNEDADVESVPDITIARLNSLGFHVQREHLRTFVASALEASPQILHRKTRTQRAASKTDQGALLLWQAAVLQRSQSMPEAGVFDEHALDPAALRRLARMSTREDGPRQVIRDLHAHGILVVIMPALPGTFLDGAVMAGASGKPIIGLTLRHDRTDSFWFTLMHEVSHIALHFIHLAGGNAVFIDDMDIKSDDHYEREADQLSRDSLIPPEMLKQIAWGPKTNYDELVTLSVRARVHLSIIAGRWQRDHQNYKRFSRLIERDTIRSMFQAVE
jgi:HTH-type transcriptional regulator/antitoxin HigA